MSLDLGALVGHVFIEDTQFQRTYVRVVRQFAQLGGEASKSAAGTARLDESLGAVSTSSAAASTNLNRLTAAADRSARAAMALTEATSREQAVATKLAAARERLTTLQESGTATAQQLAAAQNGVSTSSERLAAAQRRVAVAEERVAAATRADAEAHANAARVETQHAAAIARVAEVMGPLAEATVRDQQLALRDLAAQERLTVAREGASSAAGQQAAATAKMASAQAAAIGAADRAAASQGRFAAAMSGTVKMAAELGVLFGAMEAVKKVVDIAHEASDFQRSMVQVQTQAGATASEVKQFSTALLGMSGKVAQAPDELATSLFHVYSATKALGYTPARMLEAVDVAAKGATTSGADLEETTNALTATMVSGLGHVNNMSAAMGALNAIVGAGDMKLSDLNDALGSGLLVQSKLFGATLAQVGAALDVFGDNNIRGAHAATVLRMSIQDLSKPSSAPSAAEALKSIGLTSTSLRDDLEKGGLTLALHHLHDAMRQAGITTKQTGGFIEDVFTKRAGIGLGVLLNNLDQYDEKQTQITKAANNFGDAWTATTKTASFALKSLNDSFHATGIQIANNIIPALTGLGQWLGKELPDAVAALTGILGGPLSTAWSILTTAFRVAGDVLGPLISLMKNFAGPIGDVTMLVGGMWLAFKGGQVVGALISNMVTAVGKIPEAVGKMSESVRTSVTNYVTAMGQIGASSEAAAATSAAAMSSISDEAALMSGAVVAEGETAAVGWAGLLGPLAAVGVGIGLIVSMFHKSSDASKEAADSAKSFSEALNDTGSDQTAQQRLLSSAIDQLTKAGLPQVLDDLNSALGKNEFSGGEFAQTLLNGSHAVDTLRSHLEGLIKAGTSTQYSSTGQGVLTSTRSLSPAAQAASKALDILSTRFDGLSQAQRKALQDYKSFGMIATPISKVADKVQVLDKTAQTYLSMLGVSIDKTGNAMNLTSGQVKSSLDLMNATMSEATQTLSGFVQAWNTFSTSAGTAADRAALIGATLKAANGDALNYAAAMNGAAAADHGLATAIEQASGAEAAAAKAKKNGTSQAEAATAANRHYLGSVLNLKTGTIDYNKAAATPLIGALQSMQSAAMTAAQAAYQHARATMSGKAAADTAYKVYVNQTRGQFIDTEGHLTAQARQLGLTAGQAKKLSDRYFGMPKNVKTLIESEGQDSVVNVLKKIGRMLASVFGVRWSAKLDADPNSLVEKTKLAQQHLDDVKQRRGIYLHLDKSDYDDALSQAQRDLDALKGKTIDVNMNVHQRVLGAPVPHATGGSMNEGWNTVGEGGAGARPELVFKRGSSVQVFSNAASKIMAPVLGLDAPGLKPGGVPVPAFASGTAGSIVAGRDRGEKVWTWRGVEYGSLQSAENARASYLSRNGTVQAGTTGSGKDVKTVYYFNGHEYDSPATLHNAQASYGRQSVDRKVYGPAGSGVEGVATMLRNQIPGSARAMADLSKAVNEAFTLKGVQAQLATAKTALDEIKAKVANVRSTVSGALGGSAASFTDAGSVSDLLASISAGTAVNKSYDSEVRKLTAEGLDKTYLRHLEQSGQTTTLQTLAAASRGQIAQVNKAVGGFRGSLSAAAGAAVMQTGYAAQQAADQRRVDSLGHQQDQLLHGIGQLLDTVSKLTGHKAEIKIGDQVIGEAAFHSDAAVKFVHDLAHQVANGRKPHR